VRNRQILRLPSRSYRWSLKHLEREGDTDLFPRPFEIDALRFSHREVLEQLASLDIREFSWTAGRRFVIPKGVLAFRTATQLDIIDTLLQTALLFTFGAKIEAHRVSPSDQRVFSYRFAPQPDGLFYGQDSGWGAFWKRSLELASGEDCKWVARVDITDYYNQIYHHTVENELRSAGLPSPAVEAVLKSLSASSQGVSRGIPVGPHFSHLIAECALTSVDRSLLARGHEFARYVDDFHFFCKSRGEAEQAVFDFAEVLDKQQRLTPQSHKTELLSAEEFRTLAGEMLLDQPISPDEESLLLMIKKYTGGDPYRTVALREIEGDDLARADSAKLEHLLALYLDHQPPAYSRIGWLLRRLAQVAVPGAVQFVLDNLSKLTPVLGDVVRYLVRASGHSSAPLKELGNSLIRALESPMVEHSEYLQMMVISLVAEVPGFDHLEWLTARYLRAAPSVRREIVRAGVAMKAAAWVKERKDEFSSADPWFRRSVLLATRVLPGDEGRFWLRGIRNQLSGLEKLVACWAIGDHDLRLGDRRLV
jgi:hypothetical protein